MTQVRDTCTQGSDEGCHRFGQDMCCAKINVIFKGQQLQYHGCASTSAIESVHGDIYDQSGWSGNWFCDLATHLQLTAGAAALISILQ